MTDAVIDTLLNLYDDLKLFEDAIQGAYQDTEDAPTDGRRPRQHRSSTPGHHRLHRPLPTRP